MTIRLAEEHDAEGISATLRAAFAEFKTLYTPPAFSATTPTAEQIAERFAEGPIWIAELADTIVGTVATVPMGTELYIRSMAVRPSARGWIECVDAPHHIAHRRGRRQRLKSEAQKKATKRLDMPVLFLESPDSPKSTKTSICYHQLQNI